LLARRLDAVNQLRRLANKFTPTDGSTFCGRRLACEGRDAVYLSITTSGK